jgi:hypothetical protein
MLQFFYVKNYNNYNLIMTDYNDIINLVFIDNQLGTIFY